MPKRRGIQSADKAIDVLLALVEAGGAAPLKDLAAIAGMPTSLAHRYLASLVARGFAVQNIRTGLYDLGPLAIRVGASALSRIDALSLAGEAMPGLVGTTGLTALLTVLGDRGPTIIRWERSRIPFMTTLAVGAVLPLIGSASGRAMLAFLPRRLSEQLIKSDGRQSAEATRALRKRLMQIAGRGYDTADSTVVPGLSAISAPILDAQNEAVAALTLVGSTADMKSVKNQAAAALLKTCTALSHACGSS